MIDATLALGSDVGFLDSLTGHTKVLEFELAHSMFDGQSVQIRQVAATVPDPEYIRLWACYEAKIAFNLGGAANRAMASRIENCAAHLAPGMDLYPLAETGIRAAPMVAATIVSRYKGEYYAKGAMKRTVKTWFHGVENFELVSVSGVGLLQEALIRNESDPEALRVLTATARNMAAALRAGRGAQLTDVVALPYECYAEALSR